MLSEATRVLDLVEAQLLAMSAQVDGSRGQDPSQLREELTFAGHLLLDARSAEAQIRDALARGFREEHTTPAFYDPLHDAATEAAFIILELNAVLQNTFQDRLCRLLPDSCHGPIGEIYLPHQIVGLDGLAAGYVELIREQAELILERARLFVTPALVALGSGDAATGILGLDGGGGCSSYNAGGYHYIIGNNDDNTCGGTSGNDWFIMKGGNDWVDGFGGDDRFEMGGGQDLARGGNGSDLFFGSTGDDSLYGGEGPDVIHGEDGADILSGENGDDALFDLDHSNPDTVIGGYGADRIDPGAGSDNIWGDMSPSDGGGDADYITASAGDDTIRADGGVDTVDGGFGADQIFGGSADDALYGSEGNDVIHGGDGHDSIQTGSGAVEDDTPDVYAGPGNDFILGGSHWDIVYAGEGRDLFDDPNTCCLREERLGEGDKDEFHGEGDRDAADLKEGAYRSPDDGSRDIRDRFFGEGGDDACPIVDVTRHPDQIVADYRQDDVQMGDEPIDDQPFGGCLMCVIVGEVEIGCPENLGGESGHQPTSPVLSFPSGRSPGSSKRIRA